MNKVKKIPELKPNSLGNILYQKRIEFQLTSTDVSSAVGITVNHLGKIERGVRHPSAEVLLKLMYIYDLTANDILD